MLDIKGHCVDTSELLSGLLLQPVKDLSGPALGKTLFWEWGLSCDGPRVRGVSAGDSVPLPWKSEEGQWTVRMLSRPVKQKVVSGL